MKKLIILTYIAISALCAATLPAAETSPLEFKYYMHKIFDSYNHAEISHSLGKDDITDIHLRNMEESITLAQRYIPVQDKDGGKLDKELFLGRITKLQSMAADLRGAVKYKSAELSQTFSQEVFNMCTTCHKSVKLKRLLLLPKRTTLFGEYMHNVSVHLDQARMYEGKDRLDKRFKKQLKLITYYLDLIKTSAPDQGPSGVIVDRDRFTRQVEELVESLQKDINGKKKIDLEGIRKDLNGLCVSCHEAEHIK
jgi:cytochrome c556